MNIPTLSAILLLAQAGAGQAPMIVPDSEFELNESGGCEGNGRRVAIRRVMFIDNRSLDIDGSNLTLRYVVEGEKLRIERVGDPAHRAVIHEIAYAVSPDADIDIELKLALAEGGLALYWRETYRRGQYRQGLFRIVGERIEPLCEGLGGISRSH